jgi:hypothetical protein
MEILNLDVEDLDYVEENLACCVCSIKHFDCNSKRPCGDPPAVGDGAAILSLVGRLDRKRILHGYLGLLECRRTPNLDLELRSSDEHSCGTGWAFRPKKDR